MFWIVLSCIYESELLIRLIQSPPMKGTNYHMGPLAAQRFAATSSSAPEARRTIFHASVERRGLV